MKNNLLALGMGLILFGCADEKTSSPDSSLYVDKAELVEKEIVFYPSLDSIKELKDVTQGPESELYSMYKKTEALKSLAEQCESNNCDTYKQLASESQKKLDDLLKEGIKIKTYVDTQDKSSSYCMFDNYTPDPHDPPKVFNLKFIFPQMVSTQSPGNYESNGNGNGSLWPKGSDFAYLMMQHSIQRLNNNRPNPVKPEIPALPTRFLYRSVGEEYPRVKDEELDRLYYSGSRPGFGALSNTNHLYHRYAQSQDHISVVIVQQNGSNNFSRGNIKKNGNELVRLPNGDYDLEIHPHFQFTTTAFVYEILVNNRPGYVVRINGWLGEVINNKIWEKEPGTNNFKEVPAMPEWSIAGVFNHEMAHNLGLNHTTFTRIQQIMNPTNLAFKTNYLCDDMPAFTNTPWCGSNIDNNIMDNSCEQDNISPCQLKVMHWNAMKSTMNRALYRPGCVDTAYNTVLEENLGDVHWDAPHHVIGNIIVKNGTRLHIHCSGTTLASNAQIITEGSGEVIGQEFINRRDPDASCSN
jgi:hypothetical protein